MKDIGKKGKMRERERYIFAAYTFIFISEGFVNNKIPSMNIAFEIVNLNFTVLIPASAPQLV